MQSNISSEDKTMSYRTFAVVAGFGLALAVLALFSVSPAHDTPRTKVGDGQSVPSEAKTF